MTAPNEHQTAFIVRTGNRGLVFVREAEELDMVRMKGDKKKNEQMSDER